MFKIKRKTQQQQPPPPPPTIALSSSNSIHRPALIVSSSSSTTACSTHYYYNNNVSVSSSTSVSPQCHKYKKSSRQQRNPSTPSHSKQFLGYFRCCCSHLCSCTCECSIPSNTYNHEKNSTKFNRKNCASTFSISSSYYLR